MRVLLVQSDTATRQGLESALRAAGHEVVCADSGERALDMFVQQSSDALVVDLDLPGRDGAATIESIRWAPGGDAIAIVLTGAHAEPKEVEIVARRLSVHSAPDADPRSVTAQLAVTSTSDTARTRELEIREDGFDDDLYEPDPTTSTAKDPDSDREGRDVERRASVVERAAQQSGRLEEVPFPQIIARLADARVTGALVLTSAGDPRRTTSTDSPKKIVFFRNGIPVHVRSNLTEECLGQILRRSGVIDEATLNESLERVRRGEGRQGGILVALGAISPRDLREALEAQQREKLFDIFAWPAGGFAFTVRMTPPPETITLEMSLAEMVYLGIRDRVPTSRVMSFLEPILDRYPAPTDRHLRGLAQVVGDSERHLLMHIDGTRSFGQLIGDHRDRTEASHVLWSAHCLGAVAARPRPTPVKWDAPPEERATATRRTLQRIVPLLREGRYAEALDVEGRGAEAVRSSAANLRAQLRTLADADSTPKALRHLATETIARIERAEALLTSDAGPPTLIPPPVAPDPAALADASASLAPLEADRAALSTNALPTRQSDADAAPQDAERVADTPIESANNEVGPTSTRPERDEDLDERVQRVLEAERYFRRGVRTEQRSNWTKAVEAYTKATELVPTEGEFLVHLGWALFQSASDDDGRRSGLAELERGCRLVPKSDRAHLLRARALRAMGDDVAARNAYERALIANPECQEALDELRELT